MKKLSKQETLQALMRKYLLENIDELTTYLLEKRDDNADIHQLTEGWFGKVAPEKVNLTNEIQEISKQIEEINPDRFVECDLKVHIDTKMKYTRIELNSKFLKEGVKDANKELYDYNYNDKLYIKVEGYLKDLPQLKELLKTQTQTTLNPQIQEVVL